MFETIEIPTWTVWLAGILALIGLLDRILMPTVRWYLTRRMDKAIAVLNDKLQLKIQPFKLMQRRVMVERLAYDPQVIEAVLEHSKTEGVPYRVAEHMAYGYAREIVPSFSAMGYFGFAIKATRWLSRALYRVRLGYVDEEALKAIDPEATVVFVMNHRSNMDYILVTYLAASRSALSYAVGEWARVWPLKQLIRSMGAYFIRRKSRNLLYRRVLARYVQMATEAGVAQAVFPEGGLSRDGKLKPAKLGLLNYMVSGFDAKTSRDICFVPVGLNYDRVLEDRVLLASDRGDKTGLWFKVFTFLKFIVRHFALRITGKFYRFGYASVSFGAPVSLKKFLKERNFRNHEALTKALGRELMDNVGRVIPILPASLVARIFLTNQKKALTKDEIITKCNRSLERLLANGAYMHIPHKNFEYAVEVGLRMLVLRKALILEHGKYRLESSELQLITYYANAIAHLG
ncbi:glycerol-3-phosphate acyltransferase [Amylibacter sp. SFDW26]|uniref:1-acyl-sn-glycerol-3-phosphate acyltransferase n=1 Tax=Amylibacter sp. SFDW26 TaxID=2652722 RepID=UPI0012618BF1|nr:1-acyl-sn-glycerol-3-phosphate acyltransferase [Amylibacter sp. SFDW26]KAB7615251.1 glycerol-3-phosphate acyltransferase [Amylibacter sp. SFDW26]